MIASRRVFLMTVAASGAVLATSAHAQAMVDEKDPQAASLGYKADGTKVDSKKYPKYSAAQKCGNCMLFQGKANSAAGGCPLFGSKQVATPGWCSAWAPKS